MELTDFLLARIAEDEAPTWSLSPYACEPGCCAPAGWVGSQCRHCDSTPVYGGTVKAITDIAQEHAERIHQRSRVLAECAAKRRMVKLHALDADWRAAADMSLRLLAVPYADHPDYREEWRP